MKVVFILSVNLCCCCVAVSTGTISCVSVCCSVIVVKDGIKTGYTEYNFVAHGVLLQRV
jgi:hypothetical protein